MGQSAELSHVGLIASHPKIVSEILFKILTILINYIAYWLNVIDFFLPDFVRHNDAECENDQFMSVCMCEWETSSCCHAEAFRVSPNWSAGDKWWMGQTWYTPHMLNTNTYPNTIQTHTHTEYRLFWCHCSCPTRLLTPQWHGRMSASNHRKTAFLASLRHRFYTKAWERQRVRTRRFLT